MNRKDQKDWNRLEDDKVRLSIVADYDIDLDNLFGDTFDPEVNSDIDPDALEEQRQEEIDRINRDGVWGIVGEYKCANCDKWTQADSVWGFIGDDWKNSGYDDDVKAATLQAYRNQKKGKC